MTGSRSNFTREYNIPAGFTIHVNETGKTIYCVDASDTFLLSVDHGGHMEFSKNTEYKTNDDFESFELINETNEQVTVKLTVGYGRYSKNELNSTGTMKVENKDGEQLNVKTQGSDSIAIKNLSGDTLNVNDTDTQNSLSQLLAVLKGEGAGQLQKGVVDLSNVVHASGFGVSASPAITVINPLLNTNGSIVRAMSCYSSGAYSAVYADANAPTSWNDGGKKALVVGWELGANNGGVMIENYYLPAGMGLFITRANTSASNYYSCSYELL